MAASASFHKRLVFGSAGCALLLVILMVLGWFGMRQTGFDMPQRERLIPPAVAAAALDSLSRLDVFTWVKAPTQGQSLRCRETDPNQHVALFPSADTLTIPLAFGDTFPPGSPQRRLWMRLGSVVALDRGPPVGEAYLDSIPPGRWLLAGIRVRLDRGDRAAACVVLAALLDKAGRLESRQELRMLVGGAELERDAADMISRDAQLRAGSEMARERAVELLSALDRRARGLRELQSLIDEAGTAPASVDTLASWAGDSTLPLAVRDAFVRAIGYGWVDNSLELGLGVDRARRNAIDRLTHGGVPGNLRRTAQTAGAIMKASLPQRFQFAVTYRTRRLLPP